MIRPPPRATRTDTLFPYTTLFRSGAFANRFVAAANGIGLPLTSQGLRETLPRVTPPLTLPYGDSVAYFTRSEEHTSELQSLMRISYAVFCLKKKKDDLKDTIRATYNTLMNKAIKYYEQHLILTR